MMSRSYFVIKTCECRKVFPDKVARYSLRNQLLTTKTVIRQIAKCVTSFAYQDKQKGALRLLIKKCLKESRTDLHDGTRGESLAQTVDGSGIYEFRNIKPGNYTLELDSASVPADFSVPAQTVWTVNVDPLRNFYLDLPLAAQRAISGVIFIDRDGDGQFVEAKDEIVEGFHVVAGSAQTLTGQGSFFLRNLPAGKMEVRVYSASGERIGAKTIELTAPPAILRSVDVAVRGKSKE